MDVFGFIWIIHTIYFNILVTLYFLQGFIGIIQGCVHCLNSRSIHIEELQFYGIIHNIIHIFMLFKFGFENWIVCKVVCKIVVSIKLQQ